MVRQRATSFRSSKVGPADAAALRTAGEKLDALLHLTEADVDEMDEEFTTLRKGQALVGLDMDDRPGRDLPQLG